jgi:hypothetical protein
MVPLENRRLRLPLGFLLLVVVALSTGSSPASVLPGPGAPVAAAGSPLRGESPLAPLGQLNHNVDRLFGFESGHTTVNLLPVIRPVPGHGTYTGIQLSLMW